MDQNNDQNIRQRILSLEILSEFASSFKPAPGSVKNDIIIGLPFVADKLISITAGRLGKSYFQVILLQAAFLILAKFVFAFIRKILDKK